MKQKGGGKESHCVFSSKKFLSQSLTFCNQYSKGKKILCLHTQNLMSPNKAKGRSLAHTDQTPLKQIPFFWYTFGTFHLTIHNWLFSLSADHDFAGAGGGGEMECSGIAYISRSWVHTDTHLPGAALQDLTQSPVHVPLVSGLIAEKCPNWAWEAAMKELIMSVLCNIH